MRDLSGTPPTSHFHVAVELESLLTTLELNFFVTKYYEMSDRDGRKVAVYALNFGLCQKFVITFGRPTGKREQRLYFIERIFDCTSLLRQFMQQNQEIRCTSCGATHEIEKLDAAISDHEEILRLQVTMEDPFLVRGCEPAPVVGAPPQR